MNLFERLKGINIGELLRDLSQIIKLAFFFISKKNKILIVDLIPAHSQFTKLLVENWNRKDYMVAKAYDKKPEEHLFDNEIRIKKRRLLSLLSCDLVITFASHMTKAKLPRNTKLAHLPHSMVSLHGIYTKHAFQDVDFFFACGPHHEKEFKSLKEKYSWPDKKIIRAGYLKIDYINKLAQEIATYNKNKTVILAPSWGINNLLERSGSKILLDLLEDGWSVIVRPHPLIKSENPEVYNSLKQIEKRFPDYCIIEGEAPGLANIVKADLMISDWSGVAYEFAFGLKKPVLFIDSPPKKVIESDEDIPQIELPHMEVEAREKVGQISSENNISTNLNKLYKERNKWKNKIEKAQKDYLYHFGSAQKYTIDTIEKIINEN